MAAAKVTKRFHAVRENRTYEVGEVFEGSETRVQQLAERGYVEREKEKPQRKTRAAKAKEQ